MSGEKSVTNTIYLDIENRDLHRPPSNRSSRSRRYSLSFDGRNGDSYHCQHRQVGTIINNAPQGQSSAMYRNEASSPRSPENPTAPVRNLNNRCILPPNQKQQVMSMSTSLIEEHSAKERPFISHEMAVRLLKEYVRSLKDFSSLLQSKQDRETRDSATSPIPSIMDDISETNSFCSETGCSSFFSNNISRKPLENHFNANAFLSSPESFFRKSEKTKNISVHDLFTYIRKGEDIRGKDSYFSASPSSSHDSLSSAPPILSANNTDASTIYSEDSGQRTPVNVEEIGFSGGGRDGTKVTQFSTVYQMNNSNPTPSLNSAGSLNSRLHSSSIQSEYQSNESVYNRGPTLPQNVKSEAAFHRPYTQLLWPTDTPETSETEGTHLQQTYNGLKTQNSHMDYMQKTSVPLGLPTYTKTKSEWKGTESPNIGASAANRASSFTDSTRSFAPFQRNGFHKASTTSPNAATRIANISSKPSEDYKPSVTSPALNEDQRRQDMLPSPLDKSLRPTTLPMERVSKTITNLGQFPVDPFSSQVDVTTELKRIQPSTSTGDRVSVLSKPNVSQPFVGFHSSTTYTHPATTIRLSPSISSTESRQQNSMRINTAALSGSHSVDSIQTHGHSQPVGKSRLDEPAVIETRKSFSDWKRPNESPTSPADKNEHRWSSTTSPPLLTKNLCTTVGSSRFAPRPTKLEPSPPSPKSSSQGPYKWNVEKPVGSVINSNVHRPLSINVGTSNSWLYNHSNNPDLLRTTKADTATQTDESHSPTSLTPTNSIEFTLGSQWTLNGGQDHSELETWPLSLQSVVKPLHGELHSPQSIRKDSNATSSQTDLARHVRESSWAGPQTSPPASNTSVTSPNLPGTSQSVVRRLSLRGLRPSSLDPSRPLQNQRMSLLRSSRSSSNSVSSPGSYGQSEAQRCRSVHFSTDVLVAHTGVGPEPLMLSSAPLKEAAPVDVIALKNNFSLRAQGMNKRAGTGSRVTPGPSVSDPSTSKLDRFQPPLVARPPVTGNTRRQTLSRNPIELHHM